ncbi:RAC-alpha serine/threonine-protein kinase [Bulinus truncatus]|nr:RAC-alpha serine/threonine-protein kinase [Bulinus truncatus]
MRMSEHAVDPVIVICMSYSVSDLMNNSESIHHLDGTFPTLAQVKSVPKTKVNPNDYYALLKVLSVGKFGAIYLGYDKEARAMRTVKIFRPRMAFFPDKFSKLEKRLLTLKTLPPMLPQLFMAFSFEFQNCLVLEGLSGRTLNDRLRYARRLPELAIRWVVQLVRIQTSRQLGGQTTGQTHAQTTGQTDNRTDTHPYNFTDRQLDRHTTRQLDRQLEGHTFRKSDRQTTGQTHTQRTGRIDKWTYRHQDNWTDRHADNRTKRHEDNWTGTKTTGQTVMQIDFWNLTLDSFWIHDDGHLKLMDYTSCVAFNQICSRLAWTASPTHYTPPEVIAGGFISKMVDMWSMGVIMYRMTTGKMPFLSTTRKDFKNAIRYASVNFSHHFTTEAQHFCAGLLAKMPIHRIGFNMPTFAAMKAHEYFAHTNWDKVLLGTTEIPHVPILFDWTSDRQLC